MGSYGQTKIKTPNLDKLAAEGMRFLGRARTPGLPYEQADGSPLKVDTDYFGKQRSKMKPTAGPFENAGAGDLKLKVW